MTVSELKTAKTKDEFNRMAIVTKVGKEGGTDVEERQVAKFMTHSIDVARANYQHLATTEQAVSVYSSLNKQRTETEQPHTKRRKFTDTEAKLIKDYTSSHIRFVQSIQRRQSLCFPQRSSKRRSVHRKKFLTNTRQSKDNTKTD